MIVTVVGARPNFMKAAPIHQAFRAAGVDHGIVYRSANQSPQVPEVATKSPR